MTPSQPARASLVVSLCVSAGLAGLVAQGRGGGAASPPAPGQTAPGTPGQAQPAPTTGTAAISGVVVDGTTGQPVAGATVGLTISGRATIAGPTALITDGQGRFVFTRLPANGYALSATKLGYNTSRYGQMDPAVSTTARTIRLADGQWFADAKISVWRPAAISGRVLDEANEPVVGAYVRVLTQVLVAGRSLLAAGPTTKTDDRGWYRIAGLPAGRYVVIVPSVQATIPADSTAASLLGLTPEQVKAAETAGRPPAPPENPVITVDRAGSLVVGPFPIAASAGGSAYPITFFPSARTATDAAPIDIAYGEERSNVDVRIAPVRTVRVSGALEGPPGAGGGMVLRLMPAGTDGLGFGSEAATALTTAAGAFTFLNVPAGSYTLIASRTNMSLSAAGSLGDVSLPQPAGYRGGGGGGGTLGPVGSASPTRYTYSNAAGSREYFGRTTVTVGDQDVTNVVVALTRAAAISGRIVWAPGSTPSPGLAATGRLTLRVEPANGDVSLGMPSGTATGDPLQFRIEGLLHGPYAFRLIGGGNVKSIEWEGKDYTDRPFDAAGADIDSVLITLTTEIAKISGTVRLATGAAAGEGAVIVFPADQTRWVNYGFSPVRIAAVQVSTTGTFSFGSVPAGEYCLVAVPESQQNAWRDQKFLEAAAPVATRVTVGWGETKTADLTINAIKVSK